MDYKKEFQAARAANDWNRVKVLWTALCIEAEIEETADGSEGESASIAKLRNQQASGDFPGGKKI